MRIATCLALTSTALAAVTVHLNVTAHTPGDIASDKVAVYYPQQNRTTDALFVGNDGSATGGISIWNLASLNASSVPLINQTGRTKLVNVVYSLSGRDWVVTLAQSDSILRLFDAESNVELESARVKVWGDYSGMCNGQGYIYIFGKLQVKVFLVREKEAGVEVVLVRTSVAPIEADTCVVSSGKVLFAGDNGNVYSFPVEEKTASPTVSILVSGRQEITGLSKYVSATSEYVLVVYIEHVDLFTPTFALVGRVGLEGLENYEFKDAVPFQASLEGYPSGALVYAVESDKLNGYAVSSLEPLFAGTKIPINTEYNPRLEKRNSTEPTCSTCSNSGYCSQSSGLKTCDCFQGFAGETCAEVVCENDCNGHGTCGGPELCVCADGWAGPLCSFQVVHPKYETEKNGADGDDPAVWISPVSANQSRIVTTTKSKEGAGFAVFDLEGHKLQTFFAGEPNNVDVIYSFPLANRTVDLVYAACREENTLCLAEITSNGMLVAVPGGSQPTPEDYEVYGSCTYHSPTTDKFYLFVNAKDATYLQYEISSLSNGTLSTTLIRSFRGGSGGQVEGCVVDEENAWLILGEEPYGLWRYDAEPPQNHKQGEEDEVSVGYLIDSVEGNLFADVEGVTLVYGPDVNTGFILVSCQGLSGYNVYRRSAPHAFVKQFKIMASVDGKVDGTTNTDGITAVGMSLNADFPGGLFVAHDDVNEAADGTVSEEAAFKLVSLADILGEELLREVDGAWDPRK